MGLVAAIGTAVTAVASSVGIAVTATALTVGFTTIAAVGAVVGVVGQVTHNKVLSMVGLGLGAVGGIGALASSAGLLGSGAGLNLGQGAAAGAGGADAAAAGTIDSVAGASGLGNAAAAEEMLGLPAAGSAEAGGAGASGIGFGDALKGLSSARQILPAPGDAPPDIGHAMGSAGGADTSADALNATELTRVRGGLLNTTAPTADLTTPSGTAATTLVPPPPAPGTGAYKIGPGPGAVSGETGSFDGILKFANDHPVVALGALQAGGSLLSGMTSTLTPAQVGALNSQAAANDAATALVKQQTTNLNMPKAVASSVPVTGQAQLVPTPLRPPQPTPQQGFINQAPVSAAPITGVAA